jgi:hypothetical protein
MVKMTVATAWWWRLQVLRWMHSGDTRPLHRVATLLAWWLPCVLIPLAARLAGSKSSAAGLDFLLSLDVPLVLVVATLTALDAFRADSLASAEDWLWPRAFRPSRLRWLSRLRWSLIMRWPAGLAMAGVVLASGASAAPEQLAELLMMALLGLVPGSLFAWAIRRSSSSVENRPGALRRARGMNALSWVALRETRERFHLRRMMILSIPVLLAAPMGALATDVMQLLALWIPLLFLATVCRETTRTQDSMQRWLRASGRMQLRLAWWAWRHIVLGVAAAVALYLLWKGYLLRTSGSPR